MLTGIMRLTGAVVFGLALAGCVTDGDVGSYGGSSEWGGPGYQSYQRPRYSYGVPYAPADRWENRRPKKFEPEKHVKCNRSKQVCYEEEGEKYSPSVRETRQYFGKDAARSLKRRERD